MDILSDKKTGIVICSRLDSSRIEKKPLKKINGITIIERLIRQCKSADLPVYLAVPHGDLSEFKFLKDVFRDDFFLFSGPEQDPLKRMHLVSERYGLDAVIRVCHDKVFIDHAAMSKFLDFYKKNQIDYIYSSDFIPGTGFELISSSSLKLAAEQYTDVEHISYAIKCVTNKIKNLQLDRRNPNGHRLLIDYPEDLSMLDLVVPFIRPDAGFFDAITYLDQHPWVAEMNRIPAVTVYTCARNAEKWIQKCMGSVSSQVGFQHMEYLLIDDGSTDTTALLMSKFCSIYKNARLIRLPQNVGLAAASNMALRDARSEYITRLDADDYYCRKTAVQELVNALESTGVDIIYPDNYFGSRNEIQKGNLFHHIGGALFKTRSANFIKFTDHLRGYEGLDFFERARTRLRVGYLSKPIFFYRQRNDSMSKTDLEQRRAIYQEITGGTNA